LGGSVIEWLDLVTQGGNFVDGTGAHPARYDDGAAASILGGHLVYRYGTFVDGFGTTRWSS
jgi:hypothetical protein